MSTARNDKIDPASVGLTTCPIARLRIDRGDNGIIVSVVNYPAPAPASPRPRTDEDKEETSRLASMAHYRHDVRALGIANKFDLWCTFTFPPEIGNDIKEVKKLTSWMRSHARYAGYKITYLGVVAPHKHSDGWHIHMLVWGIPEAELHLLAPSEATTDQRRRIEAGQRIYTWLPYRRHYNGAIDEIQRIGDLDAKGDPITQHGKVSYMAQQYANVAPDRYPPPGTRKILCSRGLQRPASTTRGIMVLEDAQKLMRAYGVTLGQWGGSALMTGVQAKKFLELCESNAAFIIDDAPLADERI